MQRECTVMPHTTIPDVLLLTPDVFTDHRGTFTETWRSITIGTSDNAWPFVAGNCSTSAPWTIRGLHYQLKNPQGKLIHVPHGSIFDVAVDLRPRSPTFGKYASHYLDDRLHKSVWIPPGFAHGFMALSEGATVMYQCTTYYDEESSRALYPWDHQLKIQWPQKPHATLISTKDQAAALWEQARAEIAEADDLL